MTRSRFIVGIDLGTTNCAVAYVDTKGRERPSADIRLFEVSQLVAPGETAARSMLPSFLYLVGPHELPAGAARLPWSAGSDRVVGEFARAQGAKVPSRLVSSAKSWLCHGGVDRTADILPWGAPREVPRVSPVAASAAYLGHIRDSWNDRFARDAPKCRLENQEVVLTVPASFDEAARELTLEAARQAGLVHLTLLEEPQAAFYCWIVTHQEIWQREVRAGELILVCDIGGGTTDFSLITVVETPTGPGFRRVAVGDHLMLGGDNIDLALAHRVEAKLGVARLDTEQWSALRLACRTAKEKLLADDGAAERWPVTVAGRGARVIGGGLQSELTRQEVYETVLGGFFPMSERSDVPSKATKLGLQEFGLPFVSDPAVPRHLAAFLGRHRAEAIGEGCHDPLAVARPDAILFNGGALAPRVLRERILTVVTSWFAHERPVPAAPRVLSNDSLDLAVAWGAAYYGVVRRGGGVRIGGGTARSFYVGFELPTESQRAPWLCVVPRDAQEGDEIVIEGHDLELALGQPVAFPLASSSVRPQDRPGDLVPPGPDSILSLPPLFGLMRMGRKARSERVPVQLRARVTEVGTIELGCQSRTDERRWRLEVQLRGGTTTPAPSVPITTTVDDAVIVEQSEVDEACAAIRSAFAAVKAHEEGGVARLVKRLEEALGGPRDRWPPSALRALWAPLREVADARERGPQFESRWLNLAGYVLRPGTGYPLDESRIKALWPFFHGGVKHGKDTQCWVEWWVLWRRVAAGLSRPHHEEVYRRLVPYLVPAKGGGGGKRPARPKPDAHETIEMWRCAASLERLPIEAKSALGSVLASQIERPDMPTHVPWCLGRIGARMLLFGPANVVVPAEVVARWIDGLLAREPRSGRETTDLVFALAALCRASGDRSLDIADEQRERALGRLVALGADEATLAPVREPHERGATEQAHVLGDTLPIGLRLLAPEVERIDEDRGPAPGSEETRAGPSPD